MENTTEIFKSWYAHSISKIVIIKITTKMIFERLANGVIKHHKKIIVCWIIAVIVAIPGMLKVKDVVIYQETSELPQDTESIKASKIINEQFPRLYNSSILVVIQSYDITTDKVKNFMFQLKDRIEDSANKGEIKYYANTTSIYSIYESSIQTVVQMIAPMIYKFENSTTFMCFMLYGIPVIYSHTWIQVNSTCFMLYGIPVMYSHMWEEVNSTCFMVYGVPSVYLCEWLKTNATHPVEQRDMEANYSTTGKLNYYLQNTSLNETQKQMMFGYYTTFYKQWKSTCTNQSLVQNPPLRTEYSINKSIPIFTQSIPNAQMKQFVFSIWHNFSLSTWNNVVIQNRYTNITLWYMLLRYVPDESTLNMIKPYYYMFNTNWNLSFTNQTNINATARVVYVINLTAPTYIKQVTSGNKTMEQFMFGIYQYFDIRTYDNISYCNKFTNTTVWNMLKSYVCDESQLYMLAPYYDIFYTTWINSFKNQTNLTPTQRVAYSINLSAPLYINKQNQSMQMLLYPIFSNFNITTWNDTKKIHNFTINVIVQNLAVSMQLSSNFKKFIENVYLLGPNPNRSSVNNFVVNIINTDNLKTYPFRLPLEFVGMFINTPKNDTTIFVIWFTKDANYKEKTGEKPIANNVVIIREIVGNVKRSAGVSGKTYVTGNAAIITDMEKESEKDIERVHPVTIIVIFVVTIAFFRSIITPVAPFGLMGAVIVISQGIIYVIGRYIASIHYSVLTFMFVIIMACGTDYSIFMIARFREERKKGAENVDAVKTATTWAGESIATSGATVAIGFGSLSVVEFSMMRSMGFTMAIGVCIAILIALTLIPAILLLVGDKIFWPSKVGKEKEKEKEKKNPKKKNNANPKPKCKLRYFERSARFSAKHAKGIVIVAILISIPTTYGIIEFATSYDIIATIPNVESRKGIDAMSEGFGAGNIMKTQIVIQMKEEIYIDNKFNCDMLNSIEYLCSRIEKLDNVKRIEGITRPMGSLIDYRNLSKMPEIMQKMYTNMMLNTVGEDNRTVLVSVTFEEEPYADESRKTLSNIRDEIKYIKERDSSESGKYLKTANIYVGGGTAGIVDLATIINRGFTKMICIVLIGVFMVLLIVVGSILIPLSAIFTIAMTISWTVAVTLIVFDWVVGIPVLWMIPLILFAVLMGLGLDYTIFLLTRVREEMEKGKSHNDAVVTAVERTGGIITACGLIMAGAFGTMMLSTLGLLQEFGFALAFAIILDAIIVRIYLLPAILILLKEKGWWAPGRLQRVCKEKKMK